MDWASLDDLELWSFKLHADRLCYIGIPYAELNEIPGSSTQNHTASIIPG